jgi:peptidoglycan/LPS O-acetylase OafA/YrhL
MLAVYLLFNWLFQAHFSAALARAAIVVSYISNYWYVFDPRTIEDLGHTWTLSTEEQFYILWPVTFACLVRRFGLTWRLVIAIVAIGASIWAWRVLLVSGGANWSRLYTALDTRADALMAGSALAVISSGRDWRGLCCCIGSRSPSCSGRRTAHPTTTIISAAFCAASFPGPSH